jgi:hypothetical protein
MIDITKMPDADGTRKLMCDASTGGCGAVVRYKPTGKEKVPHIAKPVIQAAAIEPQVTVTMDEPPPDFDEPAKPQSELGDET